MAKIVGAIGTSHSPMLLTDPDLWFYRADEDPQNPLLYDTTGTLVPYETLSAAAGGKFADQLTPEVWAERRTTCQTSMDRLASEVAALNPDVLMVIGDDQAEIFDGSLQPSIAVCCADEWITDIMHDVPDNEFFQLVKAGYAMDEQQTFKGAPQLARSVTSTLVDHNFDIASLDSTPKGRGFGHAYGFIIKRLLGEHVVPVVPILMNTFFPPNQPTPSRCYDFGKALAGAIEAAPGDARVVLVASGGLSHFVVNEELDRHFLSAIRDKDEAALRAVDPHLIEGGSSEYRNWIAVAGAMSTREVLWSEYAPCYRTDAGTGCAMAFMRWE